MEGFVSGLADWAVLFELLGLSGKENLVSLAGNMGESVEVHDSDIHNRSGASFYEASDAHISTEGLVGFFGGVSVSGGGFSGGLWIGLLWGLPGLLWGHGLAGGNGWAGNWS